MQVFGLDLSPCDVTYCLKVKWRAPRFNKSFYFQSAGTPHLRPPKGGDWSNHDVNVVSERRWWTGVRPRQWIDREPWR